MAEQHQFAITTRGRGSVDITDEVLRQWSQVAGKDFTTARDRFITATPQENNGHLDLHFDFSLPEAWAGPSDWPRQSALRLTWDQVNTIIQTVKTNGVEQKDLRWGTPYIGERL